MHSHLRFSRSASFFSFFLLAWSSHRFIAESFFTLMHILISGGMSLASFKKKENTKMLWWEHQGHCDLKGFCSFGSRTYPEISEFLENGIRVFHKMLMVRSCPTWHCTTWASANMQEFVAQVVFPAVLTCFSCKQQTPPKGSGRTCMLTASATCSAAAADVSSIFKECTINSFAQRNCDERMRDREETAIIPFCTGNIFSGPTLPPFWRS